MPRTARIRLVALGVGAAAVTALAGGCAVMNPITTAHPYAPSDGIRVPLNQALVVENLMVLTDGDGTSGHILGAVVNRSNEPAEVSLTIGEGGSPIPVRIDAQDEVNLTNAGITAESLEAEPGAVVPSVVSSESSGDMTVQVPVLDGTIPPYDDYLEAVENGEEWTPTAAE